MKKIVIISSKRGFGLLGLAALIALLAALCTAVSISSMRSAAGSIRGIQRLQIQAAAEGAAVLISSGDAPTSGTVKIGRSRVTLTPDPDSMGTSATLLKVDLRAGERVVNSRAYRVVSSTDARLTVEPLP